MTPQPPAGIGVQSKVNPAPLETEIELHAYSAHGFNAVVMVIHTPAGIAFFFINPDAADALGEQLPRIAAEARTGLTIVKGNGARPWQSPNGTGH